jgi:Fe-S-cluster containining protein
MAGAPEGTFRLGPLTLSAAWAPMLHPRIRTLTLSPVSGVDCGDCRGVRTGAFAPGTRCCNHLPELPGFLAGAVLARGGSAAERVAALARGGRATPLGVHAPPGLRATYRRASAGPMEGWMACPHLGPDRGCTIYAERPYPCAAFHCIYPDRATLSLWNALASLLALVSGLAGLWLVERLGLDRERCVSSWDDACARRTAWTGDHRIAEALREPLWQGREDVVAYYIACYREVLAAGDGLRGELDALRRRQLLGRLERAGGAHGQRARAIRDQPAEPAPFAPPRDVRAWLSRDVLAFGRSALTLAEHEGAVLWYHDRARRSANVLG